MATLKAVYDSKDQIPDGLADFFSEQSDGSYKLQIEGGVKTQADVQKVMDALDRQRDISKAQKKALKALNVEVHDDGSFDEEKVSAMSEAYQNYDPEAEPGKGGNDDVEAVKKEYSQRLKDQKQDYEAKIADIQSKSKNTIKEMKLRDALLEKGVTDPIRLDDAVTRIMRHKEVDTEETEGGKYKVVIGALREDPADFVGSWVGTDEGKRYVSASNNSGGGAGNEGGSGGGGDINPWKDETFSMQKQMEIYREDKDKAARMAKAAGKKLKVAS